MSSLETLEETARDYGEYLKRDVSKELLPVHRSVDEMLTRLEEFETLMKVVQGKDETHSTAAFLKMLSCKDEIDTLRDRVDRLGIFVARVSTDLTALERQVETAEARMGVPDGKIKSILKPFLSRIGKDPSTSGSGVSDAPMDYKPPEMFKTSDYFRS